MRNERAWHRLISAVGAFLLPQLARFHFRSWRDFTSAVGAFLLPQLAFLMWL